MITKHLLALAVAICVLSRASTGQTIDLVITDKVGTPRGNLEIAYDLRGIHVENQNIKPSLLLSIPESQRKITTDANGRAKIILPRDALTQLSDSIADSKAISLELFPQNVNPSLEPARIDFLLGSANQKIALVMKTLRITPKSGKSVVIAKAFHGSRSTFHLHGSEGSIFFRDRASGAYRFQKT